MILSTEAADHLGIGLRTLYRFADEGGLPVYRVGRSQQLLSLGLGVGLAPTGDLALEARYLGLQPLDLLLHV